MKAPTDKQMRKRFPARLREYLRLTDQTQSDLARMFYGVADGETVDDRYRNQLSRWATGVNHPKLHDLERLAQVTGYTIDWFLADFSQFDVRQRRIRRNGQK